MNQFNQQFITAIIDRYGLNPDDDHVDSMVRTWLQTYDRTWIVKAIVESLHRGRYKLKSVDSILVGWQRIGKPVYKFTPEFEREILHNLPAIAELPQTPVSLMSSTAIATDLGDAEVLEIHHPTLTCDQLNPEESAPFLHHDRVIPAAYSPIRPPEIITYQLPPTEVDRPMPSAIVDSSAIVPAKQITTNHNKEDLNPSRMAPLAANFQLFHTLRAIIEPTQPDSVDIASFGFSFSSVSGK